MFFINLVLFAFLYVLQIRSQLTCTIYDFTKDTLSCVSSCSSGSVLADKNKCLRKDQYINQGNVMSCPSSITSDDRTLCCQKDEYIADSQCQVCNGNVYQNGIYCCSGSQYMNYASKTIGCTKIGTGQCPAIKLQNKFKVCCSSGQFYHLELNSCVSSSNYNCDSGLGICCNSGKYLEYIPSLKQNLCVQNCNWAKTDTFKCSQQYCAPGQIILSSGQSSRQLYSSPTVNISSTSLLVFSNQCCYGLSATGQCVKNYTANDCGKRFINRGWSVCCAFGFYYNVQQKLCLQTCTGYVIMDMICVTNNSYLLLTTASPTQTTTGFCNGLAISPLFPICCPKGFYLDGLKGCKLCIGTIHKTTYFQTCCSPNQYFDTSSQKCKACDGKVDKTGLLCCFQNQYFSYSQSGVGSCNSYCDNSNIYQTSYCCQSLSNPSCQISSYKPTVCSSQYLVDGFCQICPKYCSNIDACTTGDSLKCQKVCESNTVYFSDLDQCLNCDNSCQSCTAPFDNSACVTCADSYVMVNKVCVRCGINCKTCLGSTTNCSSCDESGPLPYLQNGQCVRYCGIGNYDDGNQCQMCNFNCVECQGNTQSQCSKCQQSSFLASVFAGECQGCSGVCNQCFKGSSTCVTCKNTYKYYPNTKTCTVSCQSNEVSIKFSNSAMEVCYPCHPACKTCQLTPQNCYMCPNNTQYLDSSFGVNLCMDCVSPCVFCSSKDNCTSCIDGYYLNMDSQKCIACVITCKTCHNGSDTGCLSCYGDSQLVGGKCIGCSSSCAKCDINQNCIECNTNYFLFSGACLLKCPDGYYGSNKKCSLCYSQCLTCLNGFQNGCLTCTDKLQLINGKCVGCSDNCQSCNVNLSCTQCNFGYFLYQQICQTSCPKGTYQSDTICKVCPSSCTFCISESSCTQCLTGYPILFKGQCLIQCPDGYQKITNSNSCQLKNTTNNNSTNNTTNNNGTNNNGTNNNGTNNNTSNTTNAINTVITSQTFYYDQSSMVGYINLYFNSTNKDEIASIVSNYKLYLVNLGTKLQKQIPVSVTGYDLTNKKVAIKTGTFDGVNINDYDAVATVVLQPSLSTSVSNSRVSQQPASTIKKISAVSTTPLYQKVSAQFYNQLIVGSYKSSPLSNIKVIGIFLSLTLLIFATLSKFKSHFLAQQANALLLHYINFAQVVYLFKYIKLDQNGYFGFLQGFGYSMLAFFPNFFTNLVPSDYLQTTNQKSLVSDANLIRNAGFVFSYQLIVLGSIFAGIMVSFGWWKKQKLQEMPQIRKIMRIGTLWLGVGFLPELFFSFAQLFVPSTVQSQYTAFHQGNIAFSYIIVFLVPILMGGIFYDFYKTYNSDVLQHYYTLREGAQNVQIYAQALVLALSIDRPLIALILIPLQLLWLSFNYMLYRYGEGYHLLDCIKFIVSSGLIILGILTLALIENIRWEIVMALIIINFIINIIYATYQVIGLYYYYLFKDKTQKDS